jgi:hypothetical protein
MKTDSDVFASVLEHTGASFPKRDPIDSLKSFPAPVDSDHDGMPDEWENKTLYHPLSRLKELNL